MKVYKDYVRFVESGFAFSKFTKSLYQYLSLNFSFIAHFNREGFYSARFDNPRGRVQTFLQISKALDFRPTGGDLNREIHNFTLKKASVFLDSAKKDREKELRNTINRAEKELTDIMDPHWAANLCFWVNHGE